MPRLIRFTATGPIRIDPESLPRDEHGNLRKIAVCACGLSRTHPFCDGSHRDCLAGERPDRLSIYDASRRNVVEERPE